MRKLKHLPFIILCMLLSGCGAKKKHYFNRKQQCKLPKIELKGETESSSKNATETTAKSSSEADTESMTVSPLKPIWIQTLKPAPLPMRTLKIILPKQSTLPSTCPQPGRHIPPVMPPLLLI